MGSRAGVAEPGEEGASSLHQDTPEAEGPSPEGSGLWGGGFAHPEPPGATCQSQLSVLSPRGE